MLGWPPWSPPHTPGESGEQRAARVQAIVDSRVPDIVLLLDRAVSGGLGGDLALDTSRVGLVGHSFGGWTVVAAAAADARVGAVVALAPGGSSRPRPGILPLQLSFARDREVPTLFLTGDADVLIPLDRVEEVFRRAPEPKRMVVLRGADHQHFVDDAEGEHEALRTAEFPPEQAWIAEEMRPIAELCSGEQAHVFTRGLALAHLDTVLRGSAEAAAFLGGDVAGALGARGVEGYVVTKS